MSRGPDPVLVFAAGAGILLLFAILSFVTAITFPGATPGRVLRAVIVAFVAFPVILAIFVASVVAMVRLAGGSL